MPDYAKMVKLLQVDYILQHMIDIEAPDNRRQKT